MKFIDTSHNNFFFNCMKRCKRDDSYHRAFIYLVGLSAETRKNIDSLFDFEEDCIKPEGLEQGWQTSGTRRICRMAFNLWNGYVDDENANAYSPEDLFCCEFAPYFACAIAIRYPEYMGEI